MTPDQFAADPESYLPKEPEFPGGLWPRDGVNGRFLCAPSHPMPEGAPGQWAHTSTQWIRDNWDSTVDYYRCVDCGAQWGSEVPQ